MSSRFAFVIASSGESISWEGRRLVLDHSGLEFPPVVPLLVAHNEGARAGDAFDFDNHGPTLTCWVRFRRRRLARLARELGDEGPLPLKASVSYVRSESEDLEEGDDVEIINGRLMKGPLVVIRKSRLLEVSLTLRPRDSATSVEILSAAGAAT